MRRFLYEMRRFLFGTKGNDGDIGEFGMLRYRLSQIDWVIFFLSILVGAFLVGMGIFVGWLILR